MSGRTDELLERLCANLEKLLVYAKSAMDHTGGLTGVYPPGTSALAIERCGASPEYAKAIAEMMEKYGVSMKDDQYGSVIFYGDYPRENPFILASIHREWPSCAGADKSSGPDAFVAEVLKYTGKEK